MLLLRRSKVTKIGHVRLKIAERMALKYGKKDYRKMNERIGKDTKVAMQLIYVQFQSLIRHLVFTYARQQNLEYLVHQRDTFKR